MSMKTVRRTIFGGFAILAAMALVSAVLLRYWINSQPQRRTEKPKRAGLVDSQPLVTAQRLAALANTPEEQEFARNASRVADHEVDMAFAAALHQATEHAPPVPAAARPILANVQKSQQRVKAEQQEIARLKQLVAKAEESAKPSLQDKLDLAEATLEVDQEDLEALRQELIRAGGDPRSKIQELKDQHEALDHEDTGDTPAGKEAKSAQAAQEGESRILLVQFRGWRQLAIKEKELAAARAEIQDRSTGLAQEHLALDEETRETKPEHDGEQHPAAAPD